MTKLATANSLNRLIGKLFVGKLLSGLLCSFGVFGMAQASTESMHTYSNTWQSHSHELLIGSLQQKIQIKIFLPVDYSAQSSAQYPSLYINDGQDADAVALADTLQSLYAAKKIAPVIVIAVSMLPDRMATYGYSDRNKRISLPAETRYGPVGKQAHEYSEWLAMNLVPYIDSQYRTIRHSNSRAMLGWSLGAANAFNIVWNYPDVFSKIGCFSPSFWLSEKANDPSTQLAQKLIANQHLPKNFSIWLAVGKDEETDDRDGDGVIDVIDDSQAVIEALSAKAMQLESSDADLNFQLTLFPEGKHSQETWKRMLPEFLMWAYPALITEEQ